MEFFAQVVVYIGLRVAEQAAPHVRKWWSEQAFPALRKRWSGRALPSLTTKLARVRSRTSDAQAQAAKGMQEAATVSAEQRKTMTGAEARKRLAAAVAARIYSDGQLQLLRSARVVEEKDGRPIEAHATDGLTPQYIGEQVALMLETDPSLLGGDTLATLEEMAASIRADGGHVSLEVLPQKTGTSEEGC